MPRNLSGLKRDAGPGRPRGSKNRIPTALREMVIEALERAGGVEYLLKQAKKRNPAPFLALVAKVIPAEIRAEVSDVRPPKIVVITGVPSAAPGVLGPRERPLELEAEATPAAHAGNGRGDSRG